MIDIKIRVYGKEVADSFKDENTTLQEVALAIYRLEEIKQILMDKDFESKLEVREAQEK